jgi:O-antigen/teichoic acid export membrane protein
MKKRNVLQNSMIATVCILLCKIIGLIYVIPFNAMISKSAGALYSYAYNIYVIFLSLSTTGVPLAVSKIVSEYNGLEYYSTRDRVYNISMKLIFMIGLLCFVIMVIFARPMAFLIIGDAVGNNTVDDVANVIRIISFALLIVPPLSVVRGYLQGYNFITESSISNVIEQFVRVVVILLGCILIIKVFDLDEKLAIGVAVFSAFISAFAAYIYLKYKMFRNKNFFNEKYDVKADEKKITNKMIIKDVLMCALPFIIVEVLKSAYATVDTVTIVRGLTDLGYSVADAETTFSVIATWGNKLCTVVISVAIGISMSLIPSVAGDYVNGKMDSVNEKYISSMLLLLITTLPMTLGIFFLAQPVWILFYGYDYLSIEVFKLYIFQAVTFSFFSVLISFCQTVGKTKVALFSLLISFIMNAIFNIPFMHLCHYLGFGGYQGATVCTLATQILPSLFLIIYIKKSFKFHYKSLFVNSLKIILCNFIMIIVLYLFRFIYPIDSFERFGASFECIVYGLIGALVYILLLVKTGLFNDLFGNSRILKKLRLIK